MRVMILGGDGYLGWPTAMSLRCAGHEVLAIDNYFRRKVAAATLSDALIPCPRLLERAAIFQQMTSHIIAVAEGDCCDFEFLSDQFRRFVPDAVVHFAEQPSAPYSMMGYHEARTTLSNNLTTTLNVIWAVLSHAPTAISSSLAPWVNTGRPTSILRRVGSPSSTMGATTASCFRGKVAASTIHQRSSTPTSYGFMCVPMA